MKVYKLKGNAKCVFCGEGADLYIDGVHVTVCRRCGVSLYKSLGEHFVPRAVPNVILRSEKQYRPLTMVYDVEAEAKKKPETHTQEIKAGKTKEVFQKFKRRLRKFSIKFKVKGETNERNSK